MSPTAGQLLISAVPPDPLSQNSDPFRIPSPQNPEEELEDELDELDEEELLEEVVEQ